MKIRHCVEKSNVEKSLFIIDPLKIRHTIIKSGKISSLSGLIDPTSHLNLDYPFHLVKDCIIAEKFELGSTIEISKEGFIFAQIHPSSYQHYGRYDYTKNLQDMVESVKKLRNMNVNTNTNFNKHQIKSLSTYDASNNVNNDDT
jgi:hypothetical protein